MKNISTETKKRTSDLMFSIKRKLLYATRIAPQKVEGIIEKVLDENANLNLIDQKLDKYTSNLSLLQSLNEKQISRLLLKKELIDEKLGGFTSEELFFILSDIPQLIPETVSELSGNINIQYSLLKQFVKCQDEALKQLCIIMYQFESFWKAREENKFALKPVNCPLIIGESGSGKTFMMEQVANVFNFQLIKIDASLIRDIHKSHNAEVIVKTIVNFANTLGIKTCAEFVHCQEVYDKLKQIGVTYIQGYYLGKPKSITEISLAS